MIVAGEGVIADSLNRAAVLKFYVYETRVFRYLGRGVPPLKSRNGTIFRVSRSKIKFTDRLFPISSN
jgi:hypothetical protein